MNLTATHVPAGNATQRAACQFGDGRQRLVYVLAASHSGSTLLTMLLARHPLVCTVGELKATIYEHTIETYPCSCGVPIRRCPFWTRIGLEMSRLGHPFDLADARVDIESIRSRYIRRLTRPLHRGPFAERLRDVALWMSPVWRREFPLIQRRGTALIRVVSEAYQRPIVVDSSKYALRLKYLLRNPALDVRVLRLIRDGRGVALTYYVDERRIPMRASALEWRRSNEEAEHLLRTLPAGRSVEVRYEQLCRKPRETIARIAEWLGIDPADVATDFRSGDHHIVGNWMRLQSTDEIVLDERWKTMLTPADLRDFDAVAGDMNRRYGYE